MSEVDQAFLLALQAARDVWVYTFDLDVVPSDRIELAFELPEAQCTPFAVDATSGVYVFYASATGQRGVLHFSAVGEVSRLGQNLPEALALVLALPCWRELALATRRGLGLGELRRLANELETELVADIAVLPLARADLRQSLGLPELTDPVQLFHDLNSQTPPQIRVAADAGWSQVEAFS